MKYIIIGLFRISFMIITFPIVFIGTIIEIIAIAGGWQAKGNPWIWDKMYKWLSD